MRLRVHCPPPVIFWVAIILGLAIGCGSDDRGPAADPSLAEPAPIAAGAGPQDPNKRFNLKKLIQRQKEELRNVPGRVGILAEKKRYSLFDEELIIRDFFKDRPNGTFVDVGCAWPIIANNTYYLEKHLGWTGIGIDALEEHAPKWERDRPGSKFFAYLVTDHSSEDGVFYKSQSLGLSSADRGRADGQHFGGTLDVEEISIPSISLNDLLDREGVTKVDLLAMDIEGHELTALNGFDIERFRPDLVVTEGKRPDVTAYFTKHGYEVIERYLPFDTVNEYYTRSELIEETKIAP